MTSASIMHTNPSHRVTLDNLVVYTSLYNSEGYFTELTDADVTIDEDTGTILIEFAEPLFARFIKLHSHYNELNSDGEVINNFAEFSVTGSEVVKAFAMVSGRNEFYNYDGKGNRTGSLLMTRDIFEKEYKTYPDSDHLMIFKDRLTGAGYAYIYDDNGNLIEKGSMWLELGSSVDILDPTEAEYEVTTEYFRYEYDLKNRLRTVYSYNPQTEKVEETASYWYNVDGLRVKKTNKSEEIHYVFDLEGKILEEMNITDKETTSSVFLKSRHLVRVSGDETLIYGTDHQGTTVVVTDEAGKMVWNAESSPFGDAVMEGDGERKDLKLKYTGKDLDEDVDLFYFNARWYDASTGRFISEDPIRSGSNWNIYVNNNPLNFIDPTGLDPHGMDPDDADKKGWNEPDDDDDEGSDPPKKKELPKQQDDPTSSQPWNDFKEGFVKSLEPYEQSYITAQNEGLIEGAKELFGVQDAEDVVDLVDDALIATVGAGGVPSVSRSIVGFVKNVVGIVRKVINKNNESVSSLPEGSSSRTRVNRAGEPGVEITNPDGSVIDITPQRVKEFVPNNHPSAPSGTLQKVKFENALPGTKGYKRTPTSQELNLLRELTR